MTDFDSGGLHGGGVKDGDPMAIILFIFMIFILINWFGQNASPLQACANCQTQFVNAYNSFKWVLYLAVPLGMMLFVNHLTEVAEEEDQGAVGQFLRTGPFPRRSLRQSLGDVAQDIRGVRNLGHEIGEVERLSEEAPYAREIQDIRNKLLEASEDLRIANEEGDEEAVEAIKERIALFRQQEANARSIAVSGRIPNVSVIPGRNRRERAKVRRLNKNLTDVSYREKSIKVYNRISNQLKEIDRSAAKDREFLQNKVKKMDRDTRGHRYSAVDVQQEALVKAATSGRSFLRKKRKEPSQ